MRRSLLSPGTGLAVLAAAVLAAALAGRTSYTVHGNAVNLAARIEALNKDDGTRIPVAQKTAGLCAGFDLVRVAEAELRGYGERVTLYTVRGDARA